MTHLRLLAAPLLATAALAVTGSALAAPAHPAATEHHVGATLRSTGKGLGRRYHLKIILDGRTAFDQTVTSQACPADCVATGLGPDQPPLTAVALRAYDTPDVVLGLYTGGAHCCFVDQVYRLNGGPGTFTKIEHNFLDAGAEIRDLNGDRNYEFLSADARLSNAGFTDFADSPAPLQIWTVAHNRFQDVTRSYPRRLAKDAATWLASFRSHPRNGRGRIAAWAADEYLLGHRALVASQLAGALRAGHLGVPASFGGPRPAKFVTQLQTLLRKLGYTR
jgi:hypothetical protein